MIHDLCFMVLGLGSGGGGVGFEVSSLGFGGLGFRIYERFDGNGNGAVSDNACVRVAHLDTTLESVHQKVTHEHTDRTWFGTRWLTCETHKGAGQYTRRTRVHLWGKTRESLVHRQGTEALIHHTDAIRDASVHLRDTLRDASVHTQDTTGDA